MIVEGKASPWASHLQETAKENRKTYQVEVRKNKRNALFEAKRGLSHPGSIMILPDLPEILGLETKLTDLEKMLICKEALEQTDPHCFKILKYLSCNLNTFREDFISLIFGVELVPVLKRFLNFKELEENLREASGIICGITFAPHEYVKILVKNDIIYSLILTSCHSSIEIAANSIWGLSNIMMDCKKYWMAVLDRNFLQNFEKFTKRFKSGSDVWKKTVIIGLKALFLYPEEHFLPALVTQFEILKVLNKKCFEWETLTVLINVAKDPEKQYLFDQYGYTDFYYQALDFSGKVLFSGLHYLALVSLEPLKTVDVLISQNLLGRLSRVFNSEDLTEVEIALWALDCFFKNNPSCVSYVVGEKITERVSLFLVHSNEKVRLESSYVMCSLITQCEQMLILTFRFNGTETLLLQGLRYPDPEYLKNVLICLKTLRRDIPIQENAFYNFLYKLEFHVNPEIKDLASSILA